MYNVYIDTNYGWALALQDYSIFYQVSMQRLHSNDTQVTGGRWRYKAVVSIYKLYKGYIRKIHRLGADNDITTL